MSIQNLITNFKKKEKKKVETYECVCLISIE